LQFQQNDLWNSFLHFCKANNACCGEGFSLTKLTDDEQKTMAKLNSILVENVNEDNDLEIKNKNKQGLASIQERMQKLKLLTQCLD
jgi:hypothetical protein